MKKFVEICDVRWIPNIEFLYTKIFDTNLSKLFNISKSLLNVQKYLRSFSPSNFVFFKLFFRTFRPSIFRIEINILKI